MHFWKSHVRSNQLDVQETNFSFAQFNRIRNHFLGDPCNELGSCSTSQTSNAKNLMNIVDFISSNVHSSRQDALLYVFEDSEAVIKMIIKGRSPTMTHVSKTNRVVLDWLFDRINFHPKIQIKYIDTKNQLADLLRRENSHVMNGIIFCVVQHQPFQIHKLS